MNAKQEDKKVSRKIYIGFPSRNDPNAGYYIRHYDCTNEELVQSINLYIGKELADEKEISRKIIQGTYFPGYPFPPLENPERLWIYYDSGLEREKIKPFQYEDERR